MHFRTVKDNIAVPLHRFGCFVAGQPDGLQRAALAPIGALGKAGYFVPASHMRRTARNFCRVTGRSDPWTLYSAMVDNLQQAALHFAHLYRYGRSDLVARTLITPSLREQYSRCSNGKNGILFLVPHLAGSVLGSAGLSAFCPTTLLVREPRAQVRCQLMLQYIQKLGPQYILARNPSPPTVMRNIMRALKHNRVVVGTTDLANPGADTIDVTAFGQRVACPAWPARIASRLGLPIVPGYIHMNRDKLELIADEGYTETDPQKSTQRWVSCFERHFRQYPSDWVFMLDKHWAKVLAAAASSVAD